MSIIIRLIFLTLSVLLAAHIVPGIEVASFGTALLVAVILGLINVTLKPVLHLLSLPLEIITLGFFSLIINGFLFALVAYLVPGFVVSTFLAAFLGSLVVSIVGVLTHSIIK